MIRKQLYPHEGPPRYSGINMARRDALEAVLTGASMVRIGWLDTAKVLVYPIRDSIDADGNQLINWVCDIETTKYKAQRDWNRPGELADFIHSVEDWHFDWLDVPALFRASDDPEYPMVDQTRCRAGASTRDAARRRRASDAAARRHGGAQSILDGRAFTNNLLKHKEPVAALKAYEAERLPPTAKIVLTNRKDPPDSILREARIAALGDKPFRHIDDVISQDELAALNDGYKRVAGFDKDKVAAAR